MNYSIYNDNETYEKNVPDDKIKYTSSKLEDGYQTVRAEFAVTETPIYFVDTHYITQVLTGKQRLFSKAINAV